MAFVVAALFLFAAEPNTMAMPVASAPQPSHAVMPPCHMAMMASAMVMTGHDASTHVLPGQPSPCKGMLICAGMLGCYGVNAIDSHPVLVFHAARADAPDGIVMSARGITHPPHNPPPIA
ncbi:MAG: hypothetical protein WCD42_10685 [Rhizomicrobium sp.]